MNVKELIAKLQTLPENAPVKVYDAYNDEETTNVIVSVSKDGSVFVMDFAVGSDSNIV